MRLVLLSAVVVAGLTAPAVACPPRDACLVSLRSTVREPAPVAPRRVTSAVAAVMSSLDVPLLLPPKRIAGDVEIPSIWRMLREQVYSRMPTYRKRDELKVMLAPVVVTSPSDTIPGLGIAGDF